MSDLPPQNSQEPHPPTPSPLRSEGEYDRVEVRVEKQEGGTVIGSQTNIIQQMVARVWPLILLLMVIVGILFFTVIPEKERGDLLRQIGALPTLTTTPTPTATITPTNTPTITPTPLAGATAITEGENREVLLLISKFDQGENTLDPQREWVDMLENPIQESRTPNKVRVMGIPEIIHNHEEARQVSDVYQATLVIWGEVFARRLRVNYTITARWGQIKALPGEDGETHLVFDSMDELETFVSRDGGDNEYVVYFVLGQLSFFANDNRAAANSFSMAENWLDRRSSRAESLQIQTLFFYRAGAYYYLGKVDEAIADLTQAIRLKPDYVEAYNSRGIVFRQQGKLDKAMADYDRAITLKPNYVEAYNNRGNIFRQQGKFEEAITDFNQAIMLKPDYPEAYNNRGITYGQQDRLDEAIADFNQAIILKPDYPEAYNNRGNAYRLQGKLDRALADLDKAIQLQPNYVKAYNNRGRVYGVQNRMAEARADFDRAIELQPDYAEAYWGRGNTYYDIDDYIHAIADYREYEQITGKLEPFMRERIAEMEAALTATPAP